MMNLIWLKWIRPYLIHNHQYKEVSQDEHLEYMLWLNIENLCCDAYDGDLSI